MSLLARFRSSIAGNVALIAAITFPALAGLALGGYSLSTWQSQTSVAQGAVDAAALAGVTLYGTNGVDSSQIEKATRTYLTANAKGAPAALPAGAGIVADTLGRTVTVNFEGLADGAVSSPIWNGLIKVKVTATARYGTAPMPVCILITELYDKHTFRASNGSKTDVKTCMVQVNTNNWDAVEASAPAYIHVTDGQSCFVGDIHFGDVVPAKSGDCTFFKDPFADYTIPTAGGCDYTNLKVTTGGTLSPGTYCGGLEIESNVTFSPGVYFIKHGVLKVTGSTTKVNATGVTFILTGKDAAITIGSGDSWTQTPSTSGKFAGFLFFLDPATLQTSGTASTISDINLTGSGIIYLAGQRLVLGSGANVKLNSGSIVASYLLPQGGHMDFTGSMATSTAAEIAMRKPMVASAILIH